MLRRAALIFVAVALPWFTGCGLNEYEKKYADESERIKQFDLADQALGNPIFFPQNFGTPKNPAFQPNQMIFLRLPKEFWGKPDNMTAPIQGLLYRYTKDGKPGALPARNELFPPPNDKDIWIREIYVAFTMDMPPGELQKKIEQGFRAVKSPTRFTAKRVGRDPIVFDQWIWTDSYKPSTSLYTCFAARGDSGCNVAVVFRIPEDKKEAASIKNAIQFTLQSVVAGAQAPPLRQNFKDRKDTGKKA